MRWTGRLRLYPPISGGNTVKNQYECPVQAFTAAQRLGMPFMGPASDNVIFDVPHHCETVRMGFSTLISCERTATVLYKEIMVHSLVEFVVTYTRLRSQSNVRVKAYLVMIAGAEDQQPVIIKAPAQTSFGAILLRLTGHPLSFRYYCDPMNDNHLDLRSGTVKHRATGRVYSLQTS